MEFYLYNPGYICCRRGLFSIINYMNIYGEKYYILIGDSCCWSGCKPGVYKYIKQEDYNPDDINDIIFEGAYYRRMNKNEINEIDWGKDKIII